MAAERRPVMAAGDGPPPGVSRARRLLWRVWPDRNPLRRAADRAERALLVVLFALFAAGIPAAALAVGHWAGLGAARAARVAAATQRPVSAHLLHSAPPSVGPANPASYLVSEPAWWADSEGVRHIDTVLVAAGTKAGTVLHEWTDTAGGLTGSRIDPGQLSSGAVLAAIGTVLLLIAVLVVITLIIRRHLDRRRLAGWEDGWTSVGPEWTGQH
jgi:hypothetical protein